eukprot:2242151-Amphidinium_carterae.1
MTHVAQRRPEFEGIQLGLDNRTLKDMQKLSARTDHASRAILNAASGGLWTEKRTSKIYDTDEICKFCQETPGSPVHVPFDCAAFELQSKEAGARRREEGIPLCVQVFGLGTLFPSPLPTAEP